MAPRPFMAMFHHNHFTRMDLNFVFEGKHHALNHKRITASLLEAVQPIRSKMIELSAHAELGRCVVEDEELLQYFELHDGVFRQRPDVDQAQLQAVFKAKPKLMRCFMAPTAKMTTDPIGRDLMIRLAKATVDMSYFPPELKSAFGTEHEGEGASDFWREFDLIVLMNYVETFCSRARI